MGMIQVALDVPGSQRTLYCILYPAPGTRGGAPGRAENGQHDDGLRWGRSHQRRAYG